MKLYKRAIKEVNKIILDDMKTLGRFFTYGLTMVVLSFGCSQKVSNDRIDALEGQEQTLKKTTQLNNYKLELERNMLKQTELTSEVDKINREASSSAGDAQQMSGRVSRNPGETGVAKRADRASREAASDAKRARKLNGQLDNVNNKIKNLEGDIQKTQRDVDDLKAKIEFVPNN